MERLSVNDHRRNVRWLKAYRVFERMAPSRRAEWSCLLPAGGKDERGADLGLTSGRYRLIEMVGQGSMGRVWRAEDTVQGTVVAYKEMRIRGDYSNSVTEMRVSRRREELDVAFKQEFYTMAKLQHPHTPKVFDCGFTDAGDRYLTMEFVEGRGLREVIDEQSPLPIERICVILIDLATVLGFVHSRLYVHCDLKSANVLVTPSGAIKLMDFGLMHQLGTPAGGALKGTIHYMAPEMPRGGIIDARTDLYSLGILAFELSTGRVPFLGQSPIEVISQHLEAKPPRISQFRAVPQAFEDVVFKLLEKNPDKRYQDATEVVRDIAKIAGVEVQVDSYSARVSYLRGATLVGREKEQIAFDRALLAMRKRRSRSLMVSGMPGAGKSRLLQEFRLAVKLADIPYVVGHCRAEGQAPLGALVEALAQILPLAPPETLKGREEALSALVPTWRQGQWEGGDGEIPELERKAAILTALREWLQDYASKRAFVICFEDLHWADPGTIEYMNEIIRSLHETKAMVVGTFRSNEVDRLSGVFSTIDEGVSDRMELTPFAYEDTCTLVRSLLGGLEVADAFLQRLHRTTSGNCFFVTEILRTFIDEGVLRLEGNRWEVMGEVEELSLPPTLENAIQRRVTDLPEDLARLCRVMAPLGNRLDLGLLAQVITLEPAELFAALERLTERQFVVRIDGTYYFTHDTVRSVIYNTTSDDERRLAHAAIGEALQNDSRNRSDARYSLLAYHFTKGDVRDKAIHYLLKAAQASSNSLQLFQTVTLLTQAADLIEKSDDPLREHRLVELWSRIIELGLTAHPKSCAEYAERLLAHWEEKLDVHAAVAEFNETCRRLKSGGGFLSRRRLRKIWSEQPIDPDDHSALHLVPKMNAYRVAQAFSYASMGDTDGLQRVVERLLEDNPDPGPFRGSALIPTSAGASHSASWALLLNNAMNAKRWFDAHMKMVGEMPQTLWRDYAWSHYLVLLAQAFTGRPLDEDIFRCGSDLCDMQGIKDIGWSILLTRLVRGVATGDPNDMSRQIYDRLMEDLRKMGNPQMLASRLPLYLCIYWLTREEEEQAEAACEKLTFWADKMPHDSRLRRYALIHRAIFAATFWDAHRAEISMDAALRSLREVTTFRLSAQLHAYNALLQLQLKRPKEAVVAAEAAMAVATDAETGNPWDEATALRIRARVIGGDKGKEDAHRAGLLAEKNGLRLPHALALWTVAQVTGDRGEAMNVTGRSLAILEQLQCRRLIEDFSALRARLDANSA